MADVDENCIFCKIARGDLGTEFVAESENVVAFNDNSPSAPVHVLIVPKSHVQSVQHLGADEAGVWQEMLGVIHEVAEKANVVESGYRLVTNAGPESGQEVLHLHIHLIGGRKLRGIG